MDKPIHICSSYSGNELCIYCKKLAKWSFTGRDKGLFHCCSFEGLDCNRPELEYQLNSPTKSLRGTGGKESLIHMDEYPFFNYGTFHEVLYSPLTEDVIDPSSVDKPINTCSTYSGNELCIYCKNLARLSFTGRDIGIFYCCSFYCLDSYRPEFEYKYNTPPRRLSGHVKIDRALALIDEFIFNDLPALHHVDKTACEHAKVLPAMDDSLDEEFSLD